MISRRNFIKALVGGAVLLPFSNVRASLTRDRSLKMINMHTGERLNVTYFSSGRYDPVALDEINCFLRCHFTGEVKEMDIKLLDLLCKIKDRVARYSEIKIISGYRSPSYNELLIQKGRNVGSNSLHLKGLAIDFSIDGVRKRKLSDIARSFAAGGVGKYRDFVHIDVGRVRYW
jgi:uncharacterized protein YcbK (DUF882 family)